MDNSGSFLEKWKQKRAEKKNKPLQPVVEEIPVEAEKRRVGILEVFRVIGLILFRLRKIFMAIPVVYAALRLAAYNTDHLPLLVGLNLQSTGEFAYTISRQNAVFYPLVVTAACLVLMLFSRKSVYPWLISIFSLVLPILLLITNMYPA